MPISATRRLSTGGWGSPKIDVKEPVFYAPLWRPDMVANGGGIKNGTGTMDVSPQNLAVGANTITVTAAGTLIVYMPEGGTVASGTMTVTGSPVTVSAGIATTITTTGAIGNITVTPSNIIRSKDVNNYAMTITGATWGLQGRSFDGIDDSIDCGNPVSLQITGALTLVIWFRRDAVGANHTLLDKDKDTDVKSRGIACYVNNTTSLVDVYMFQDAAGTTYSTVSSTSTFTNDNTFHQIAAVFVPSTSLTLYINGLQQAIDTSSVISSIFNSTNNWGIGKRITGTAYPLSGVIGEVFIYNRALTSLEVQRNYLSTKGRYS